MTARSVEGFLPQALRFGLASEEGVARLPTEVRAIAAKAEHVMHVPAVTAIRTRVGG